MKLSAFELDDVIPFTIRDSEGEPTDVIFQLAGPGHPLRVDLDSKLYRRSAREFNKEGKTRLPEDPATLREQETTRLVALTLGWSGMTNGNGEEVPFSPEKARELYENRRSSVRTQVSRALLNIANFTPVSSTS